MGRTLWVPRLFPVQKHHREVYQIRVSLQYKVSDLQKREGKKLSTIGRQGGQDMRGEPSTCLH